MKLVVAQHAAANRLARQGCDEEQTVRRNELGRAVGVRPLDVECIVESVKKTNRIVSVEEGWPFAGIGSEIAALMMEHAFDWLDAPLIRVAGADVPLPYAANLEKLALPQPETIVAAAKQAAYKS